MYPLVLTVTDLPLRYTKHLNLLILLMGIATATSRRNARLMTLDQPRTVIQLPGNAVISKPNYICCHNMLSFILCHNPLRDVVIIKEKIQKMSSKKFTDSLGKGPPKDYTDKPENLGVHKFTPNIRSSRGLIG